MPDTEERIEALRLELWEAWDRAQAAKDRHLHCQEVRDGPNGDGLYGEPELEEPWISGHLITASGAPPDRNRDRFGRMLHPEDRW